MIDFTSFEHKDILGLRFGYHPFGKPQLQVFIYYVDGLLIDTGQSKARQRILSETKDLNVEQIFITHHHEDHSGNIRALQELHNCEVYASEACSKMMKDPPKISLAQKLTWGSRPAFREIIPKNQTIKTNKYCFEIIPVPGHAKDMVALYEPNKKWLFSADLYINSYIDYMLENESIADQIESVQRVLQLDFEELFCSHKPRLANGKEHLTKKLNFLESFFNDVSQLYKQGFTDQEIFEKLKFKENRFVKFLSGGSLSKINMVKSVIRDLENKKGFDI